jgi:hypothetical protein
VALKYLIKSSEKIKRSMIRRFTEILVKGFSDQTSKIQETTFQKRMEFMDQIGILLVKNEEELFDIYIDILSSRLLGHHKSQDLNSRQLGLIRKIQEYIVMKLY